MFKIFRKTGKYILSELNQRKSQKYCELNECTLRNYKEKIKKPTPTVITQIESTTTPRDNPARESQCSKDNLYRSAAEMRECVDGIEFISKRQMLAQRLFCGSVIDDIQPGGALKYLAGKGTQPQEKFFPTDEVETAEEKFQRHIKTIREGESLYVYNSKSYKLALKTPIPTEIIGMTPLTFLNVSAYFEQNNNEQIKYVKTSPNTIQAQWQEDESHQFGVTLSAGPKLSLPLIASASAGVGVDISRKHKSTQYGPAKGEVTSREEATTYPLTLSAGIGVGHVNFTESQNAYPNFLFLSPHAIYARKYVFSNSNPQDLIKGNIKKFLKDAYEGDFFDLTPHYSISFPYMRQTETTLNHSSPPTPIFPPTETLEELVTGAPFSRKKKPLNVPQLLNFQQYAFDSSPPPAMDKPATILEFYGSKWRPFTDMNHYSKIDKTLDAGTAKKAMEKMKALTGGKVPQRNMLFKLQSTETQDAIIGALRIVSEKGHDLRFPFLRVGWKTGYELNLATELMTIDKDVKF